MPSSVPRSRQSSAGCSSRPITNSIITTPNSAKCSRSCALAADEPEAERADRHAGEQVAEHAAEPEPRGDRHRDHRGGQVHERLEEVRRHGAFRSPSMRRPARRLRARRDRRGPSRSASSSRRSRRRSASSGSTCVPCTTNGGSQRMPHSRAVCSSGASSSPHREAIVPLVLVRVLGAARADGVAPRLAVQRRAAVAVRPAVREHEVLPLLHERRRAVPVERVLPHDHIVRRSSCLLARHVDVEVGIALVQVVHGHVGHGARRGQQGALHARVVERRVREEHQHALCRTLPPSVTRAAPRTGGRSVRRGGAPRRRTRGTTCWSRPRRACCA